MTIKANINKANINKVNINKTKKNQLKKSSKKTKIVGNKPTYFEIVFVRHAETLPNVNHLGAYDNYTEEEYYPITKHGELQAKETGKAFKKRFKSKEFDLVFSSPRHRCVQTAEGILNGMNTPNKKIITDELLLEGVAGVFNMKTDSERELIRANNKEIDNFYKKRSELRKELKASSDNEFNYYKTNKKYGEYLEGENAAKVLQTWTQKYTNKRFNRFLNNLRANSACQNKRILVVGHGYTVWGMFKAICPGLSAELFDLVSSDWESLKNTTNCCTFSAVYENDKFKALNQINTTALKYVISDTSKTI